MTLDPVCGKSWGGLKAEHCTGCHETFSGTAAGDRHRKGPGDDRHCVDPASVGLHRDARGVWRGDGSSPHAT